jgi:hypothetical protein
MCLHAPRTIAAELASRKVICSAGLPCNYRLSYGTFNQSINVTSHTPLECHSLYPGIPVEEVVADAAPHPLLSMHQTLNMHL